MPRVPREHVEAARELSVVASASLDELTLAVEFVDGQCVTILLTEDYPRGEPALLGAECRQLRPGVLVDLVQEAHAACCGTMGRQGTTASSYGGDDGGYGGDSEMFEYQTSSQLDATGDDIAKAAAVFGEQCVSRRQLDASEWVSLCLPLREWVDRQTATAWGIAPRGKVDFLFKFETSQYMEQNRMPAIEVSQAGSQFQLGQQLANILRTYLERCWRNGRFQPLTSAGAPAAKAASGTVNIPIPKVGGHKAELRSQLIDMGFEIDRASFAASQCDTLEEALDFDVEAFLRRERARLASALPKDEGKYNPDTDEHKIVRWSPDSGFLLHIAEYIKHRLTTSAQYCVICDRPHLFGANMLRASVCSRDVCVFAFQELDVGSDAADMIATDGGVIDLLIKMFRAAAASSRADKIFEPYPHVMHPTKPREPIFDPKSKNIGEVREVLKAFPSVSEVLGADSVGALKAKTAAKDFRVFPLIEWIINSNRSLIVKLQKEKIIPSMKTEHQFLLVTAPPDKQKKFNELKKKHGTKFAFHGSGIENWHAILRTGLRNLSNTDLMTCGAAHGSGIYLACEAQTSMGYSGRSTGTSSGKSDASAMLPGLINESGMVCMALCEVVTSGINDHGWCWTVADENCVMTRFFFVFEQANAGVSASTKNDSFIEEIHSAMKYYNVE